MKYGEIICFKFWPTQKLKTFREGVDKLENAIKKYPNNIDLRMVRFAVQQNAPRFLDYYSNIEEDKLFLSNKKKDITLQPKLKELITGLIEKFA